MRKHIRRETKNMLSRFVKRCAELKLSLLLPKGPGLTKEDKESLRQKELKQMKAKYGLQVSVKLTAAFSQKFRPSFCLCSH